MFEQEVDDFMRTDQTFIIWQMNDINDWGRFNVTDILAQITILTANETSTKNALLRDLSVRKS